MEYITLKNSDIKVSRLCMGGCPLGGYGWGETKQQDLMDGILTAFDLGVTFFDTADTYGLGKSEELLGQALENHRREVVIATKFGVRIEQGRTFYDNSPEWINESIERSLRRLKTDYIDLYQIHYRDDKTEIGSVVETLEGLKKKGLIRCYGLSNVHSKDFEELKRFQGDFVSFQDEFSLACRKNEKDIFEISEKLNLTPLTWGSLGQGILTGKYDENVRFEKDDRRSREIYENFHGEKLLKNLEIVREMKKIAKEKKTPVSAVAIRWILDYLPKSVVLAGVKNKKQAQENALAFGWKLSEREISLLEKAAE